ncbi:hypothetical protein NDU88_002548 [Pleurodeles waltl]|uniref:Uncharacterized protein n=1 Tax=Pleurodeles waltl TaxID=8319 RepID=A0AAV7UAW0_PLEWA|nr:hypothetical protein NDU88_002548 [Pleurodeles waltl]
MGVPNQDLCCFKGPGARGVHCNCQNPTLHPSRYLRGPIRAAARWLPSRRGSSHLRTAGPGPLVPAAGRSAPPLLIWVPHGRVPAEVLASADQRCPRGLGHSDGPAECSPSADFAAAPDRFRNFRKLQK